MEAENKGNMTVEQLIDRLKTMNPKAEIKIAIRQYNKVHAVFVTPIKSNYTINRKEPLTHLDFPVDDTYGGSITINLPDKSYISRLPK